MPSKKKSGPKYLIDVHGIVGAFSSSNNSIKNTVASSLSSGLLGAIEDAGPDLQNIDEGVYSEFQIEFKGKRYQKPTVAEQSLMGLLMETNGTGPVGGLPLPIRFKCVAICMKRKLTLVSFRNALTQYKGIKEKCKLDELKLLTLEEFSAEL